MNRAEYINLLWSHYPILERWDALSRAAENGGWKESSMRATS